MVYSVDAYEMRLMAGVFEAYLSGAIKIQVLNCLGRGPDQQLAICNLDCAFAAFFSDLEPPLLVCP